MKENCLNTIISINIEAETFKSLNLKNIINDFASAKEARKRNSLLSLI